MDTEKKVLPQGLSRKSVLTRVTSNDLTSFSWTLVASIYLIAETKPAHTQKVHDHHGNHLLCGHNNYNLFNAVRSIKTN